MPAANVEFIEIFKEEISKFYNFDGIENHQNGIDNDQFITHFLDILASNRDLNCNYFN